MSEKCDRRGYRGLEKESISLGVPSVALGKERLWAGSDVCFMFAIICVLGNIEYSDRCWTRRLEADQSVRPIFPSQLVAVEAALVGTILPCQGADGRFL
jgi:hypothetical protein